MNSETTQTQIMEMDVVQRAQLRKDTYVQAAMMYNLTNESDVQLGTTHIETIIPVIMFAAAQNQKIIEPHIILQS